MNQIFHLDLIHLLCVSKQFQGVVIFHLAWTTIDKKILYTMAIPVMEFQVQGYKISKTLLNCKETLVFVLFFWIYLCRNSWVIGKQYVFDREPYAHNSTTGTTILLHTWSFFGRISFAWPGVRSHILFLNRLWDKIITVIGTYKLTTKQQITKADPAKINCSKCAREGVFHCKLRY